MPTLTDTSPKSNTLSPRRAARRLRLIRAGRRNKQTRGAPRMIRVRPGEGAPAALARQVHHPAPTAYARTAAWQSRRHYLLVVVPALLRSPRGRSTLHAWGIEPDTFARWARWQSLYADRRNGRGCAVRPDTVARRAGLSERHVQRCRAAARELGALVDVVPGRRLTEQEAAAVRAHDGGHLIGFSTVCGFAVPAWLVKLGSLSPLPQVSPRTAETLSATGGNGGPSAGALRGEAAPSALSDRRRSRRRRHRPPQTASQRAALALARATVARIGWLEGSSPWRILPALRRFAAAGWSADDLVDAIDQVQARCGYSTPDRGSVWAPFALLAHYLRGLDVDADHPHPELRNLRRHPIPWCGTCDPLTRLHGLDSVRRCERCHPLAVAR